MITMDMRTVMFANVIITGICLIVLALSWYQNRSKYSGLNFWVAAWIMQVGGALLIALRETIPGWSSIVLGNSMMVGGIVVLYYGLRRFVEKNPYPPLNYGIGILFMLFVLITVYLTFFDNNLAARVFNFSIAFSLVCLLCIWLLLKEASHEIRRISKGLAVSFALIIIFHILRMIDFAVMPNTTDDLFKGGLFDALMVLLLNGSIVFLTFNLVLMVNRRLYLETRQMEETIAKSEKLYRSLFDNMLNGFAYCQMVLKKDQPPDFVYLAVNQSFERLTGLKKVVGKRVSEVIPGIQKSDAGLLERYAVVADGGQPETLEVYLEALKMWLSISVYSPQRGYFVAVFDVITERKNAEVYRQLALEILTNLNKSNELPDSMQQILTTIKGMTGMDAAGIRLRQGLDFPYFVAAGFDNDFLMTENSLLMPNQQGGICLDENGNPSLECTCGLVLSGKTDPSSSLFTPGGSFWINNSLPLLDLSTKQDPRLHPRNVCIHRGFFSIALIPIRSRKEIIGLLQLNSYKNGAFTLAGIQALEGIAGLIGEWLTRRLAEQALTESELRYRILTDTGQALIWTAGPDKSCDYFNRPWLNFTGRTLAQELGNGWVDGVHPEDLHHCLGTYNMAFDKRERFSMEYRLRHASGEYRWVQDDGSPRYDAQGNFLGYIGHCLDITERKKAEEILKDEIKIRTHFIDILAHELKSPLSPIMTATGILKDLLANGQEENLKRLAQNAYSGTQILSGRLDELLDMARYSRGAFDLNVKLIDMERFIEEVTSRYQPAIEQSGHELVVSIPARLPELKIDSSKMEQVVINLLSNACKYSPEGTRIELIVRIENDHLLIEVKDAGRGLSESDQKILFQPYHRLTHGRQRVPGLGLGLSICKQIVEAHGGNIQVYSRSGQGSTFTVSLPAKQ